MRPRALRSNALTGTLFHQVLAGLMGPNGWQAALEPGELADSARLARHAYDKLLGPRLTEMQAALRESGAEAMEFWEAVQATCTCGSAGFSPPRNNAG